MMLNNLPSKFIKQSSPQSYHYIAETFRKALMYRTQRPYDPNTYQQIQDKVFLNKNFSYILSESIRDSIDPSLPLTPPPSENEDTTHLSVMDKEGNAVGITQSIECAYGSKAAAEGLGFLYNNYMSSFEYENQNYPHYLRPNTIPWTSVAPTLVFYKQKLWMVLGTPGSDRIPTVVSQFLYSIIDGGLSIDQAMTKPRFHCSVDGTISIETERFDDKVISYLEEMGYKIDNFEPYSFFHGAIHAVLKKQTGNGFQGTAEIRRDGTAQGP
jgi:gamma-glutamyltranspeptidase/glutathione hydrolase